MPDRPKPPKPCPLCRVAMQLKSTSEGMVYVCRPCELTIAVAPEPKER